MDGIGELSYWWLFDNKEDRDARFAVDFKYYSVRAVRLFTCCVCLPPRQAVLTCPMDGVVTARC